MNVILPAQMELLDFLAERDGLSKLMEELLPKFVSYLNKNTPGSGTVDGKQGVLKVFSGS